MTVLTASTPGEQSAPAAMASASLQVRLWRPTSNAVVVDIAGELDTSSAPRLLGLLAPRLDSTIETLVLDLSELEFLGVAGLEVLGHVRQRAAHQNMSLCLVDGPVCVDRALRAAGWTDVIPTYHTLDSALTDVPGQTREESAAAAGAVPAQPRSATPSPRATPLHASTVPQQEVRINGATYERCSRCGRDRARTAKLVDERGEVVATTTRCTRCTR